MASLRASTKVDGETGRRSLFKGVWDAITENMETKPSQLEEEIGIETDKAVGLRIEDFTNLVPRHPKRRRI